jgi:hypothetical protein
MCASCQDPKWDLVPGSLLVLGAQGHLQELGPDLGFRAQGGLGDLGPGSLDPMALLQGLGPGTQIRLRGLTSAFEVALVLAGL